MGNNFLPSDQKIKEVNIHEKPEAVNFDERLAKGTDIEIQTLLKTEFVRFAKESLGVSQLSKMNLRARKNILDSLKIRKDTFNIDPKKWSYNWRAFENKIMSF